LNQEITKEKKKKEKGNKPKFWQGVIFLSPSVFESSVFVLFCDRSCQIIHYLSSFSSSFVLLA